MSLFLNSYMIRNVLRALGFWKIYSYGMKFSSKGIFPAIFLGSLLGVVGENFQSASIRFGFEIERTIHHGLDDVYWVLIGLPISFVLLLSIVEFIFIGLKATYLRRVKKDDRGQGR